MDISQVTIRQLRDYLHYIRTEYTPRRITGNNQQKLSGKTINNIWATLSSFFSWASVEFEFPSPMKQVPRPKFAVAPVEPFSRENIEDLLKACDYCAESKPYNRRKFRTRRATAKRDRAIILTLLDTGLGASELCSFTVGDVDLKTGRVEVQHGLMGGAKGSKGRVVFLGKIARRTLWRYLAERIWTYTPRSRNR